ncbi:type I glyceraldehyde-3-phosphate dehydrogenase [Candidatus Bathyarchaeota archaeon]|nr:type I glyceraldehyde-3-phosphate dehydrogenase [Candidatus Bathyarchaeota archaeon]
MGVKVAVNGFGRTGRLALRAAMEKGSPLEFVAVNRGDAASLGHLLKYDSVHGRAPFTVEWDKENIYVDGKPVRVLYESDAEKLPWRELGVEIVIEASDQYRSKEAASKHLKAGAKKVLVAAPGKNVDCTIVLGVNEGVYDKERHHVVSNASCTTNCLAPIAKVLSDTFGIKHGLMTTCHGYTSKQVTCDVIHKVPARGRAAAVNIIPTTTGAAKALGKVVPELDGKLNGMAFRVPVADGSVVDLVAECEKESTVEAVNAALKEAAEGAMKGILKYVEDPIVSSDCIGDPHSCIVDATSTMVIGDHMVKVVAFYDNEWGYSNRVVDLMEMAASL